MENMKTFDYTVKRRTWNSRKTGRSSGKGGKELHQQDHH